MSISQEGSSSRTDSQSDTNETVEPCKSESSDVQNESRDRLLTGSSDDDVFESVSIRKQVNCQFPKKRNMPKMGLSADMRTAPKTNFQHQPNVTNHSNHQYHVLVSSNHPNHYHVSSITNPYCVQNENPYHIPSNIYNMPPEISYRDPQTPSHFYHSARFDSPHNQPSSNFHYYEELDNIETSFMYREDMLPSNNSNSSQTALLPSNSPANDGKAFKPYQPITTINADDETLETMI